MTEGIHLDDLDPQRRPVDWAAFWGRPKTPRQWLAWPFISRGELSRLYSVAKVGKSLLTEEALVRLATGGVFLDRQCPAVDTVIVDQENTLDDWRERFDDFGLNAAVDLSRLHLYSLESWPPLDTAEGGTALSAAVQAHSAALVAVDTQSKLLVGDEDRATTGAAFYRHTLVPLKRAGIAVWLLDHAGNDPSRPRGTSAKRDDVDSVWRLTARGTDRLTATCTHSRRRCDIDKLFLYRAPGPLRHVMENPDEREEHFVELAFNAIAFLADIDPLTASTRAVEQALRKADKKFRSATVREAHRRFRETYGPAGEPVDHADENDGS